ncbi:hypothetical protein [Gynuella sp.]|uniref:hypothetical protein n=1 Tax=Gynuella sp. TaxID=2969146 RepID=UPI003D0C8709
MLQKLKKINPTAAIMLVLTIAFIWVQWPTHVTSSLPEKYLQWSPEGLGFTVKFEAEPKSESISKGDNHVQLFTLKRKGINFMVQVINRGNLPEREWLKISRKNDEKAFAGGNTLVQNKFEKAGHTIHEFFMSNDNHFVNMSRVVFTEQYIYKWTVAFKEKESDEQTNRVLTFLDSFTLQ